MRWSHRPKLGVHHLRPLRLGTLRMIPAPRQLPLFDDASPALRWETLDERARGTQFIDLPVRRILNSASATHMGFWSINPYIGCEFGCTYCYARDTHRYTVERARQDGHLDEAAFREFTGAEGWEAFEQRILVKRDAADILRRTLEPHRLAGSSLVIGTATDPYQPAERRFRVTQSILEALTGFRGLTIGIITKSPLITRDIDLLSGLSRSHHLSVHFSIATANSRLARRLEPRSPIPSARLRALGRVTAAGIRAGVLIAPIIPGITDDVAGLSALLAAAHAEGASYAVGNALRLGPAARRRFLPYLEHEFPRLAGRYRRHYATADHASPAYQHALAARMARLQRLHGFDVNAGMREAREWREGRRVEDEQPALL